MSWKLYFLTILLALVGVSMTIMAVAMKNRVEFYSAGVVLLAAFVILLCLLSNAWRDSR